MRTIASRITNALLPARCAGLRAWVGEPVCRQCACGLRRAPRLAVPAGLDGWVAAFAYEGVARELVARVKYRNQRAAVPWLADAIVDALATVGLTPHRATVVTWAPASTERRRARGFDHGELLARAVARRLALPAAGLLARPPGPAQTGRTRSERGPGPPLRAARPTAATPAAVLLVDDVVTTGATLSAATAVLRRSGTRRVVAATAAATPRPGG